MVRLTDVRVLQILSLAFVSSIPGRVTPGPVTLDKFLHLSRPPFPICNKWKAIITATTTTLLPRLS